MAQKHIAFGNFPNDLDADSIRDAFSKIEDNFTELYIPGTLDGVTSINAGSGLAQNRASGNVTLSANINRVKVKTSTLSIGVNANGHTDANLTRGADTLYIDIGPTIDAVITTASQPNITSVGTLTGLTVSGQTALSSTTTSTEVGEGALVLAGGASIARGATIARSIKHADYDETVITDTSVDRVDVATTSVTNIHVWNHTIYNSCKYMIQIKQGSSSQFSECVVVYGDSNSFITTTTTSSQTLGVFAETSVGDNTYLRLTMASASPAIISIHKTLFKVLS